MFHKRYFDSGTSKTRHPSPLQADLVIAALSSCYRANPKPCVRERRLGWLFASLTSRAFLEIAV